MGNFKIFDQVKSESNLGVRIKINHSSLEEMVNNILPETLLETKKLGGKKVSLTAKKAAPVKFVINDFEVLYKVPLDIEVVKELTMGNLEASGLIELFFNTHFEIEENWEVSTKTEFIKYNWIDAPRFKAGFLDLSIENVADFLIKKATENIIQNIDNQLIKVIDLKSRLPEFIEKITPVQVMDTPTVFLFFKLNKMELFPPKTSEGEEIKVTFNSNFFPVVYVGDKKKLNPVKGKIPKFINATEDLNSFTNLTIPWYLTIEELEKTLQERVAGESFNSGNNKVIIDDLNVEVSGRTLKAVSKLSGSFEGYFYLSFIPVFDQIKSHIILEELSFDLKTDNFLMKSVGWMFKKTLKNKIKTTVEDYLKNIDAELLKICRTGFKNINQPPGVELRIDFQSVKILDFQLFDEMISLVTNVTGEADLGLMPHKIYSPPR